MRSTSSATGPRYSSSSAQGMVCPGRAVSSACQASPVRPFKLTRPSAQVVDHSLSCRFGARVRRAATEPRCGSSARPSVADVGTDLSTIRWEWTFRWGHSQPHVPPPHIRSTPGVRGGDTRATEPSPGWCPRQMLTASRAREVHRPVLPRRSARGPAVRPPPHRPRGRHRAVPQQVRSWFSRPTGVPHRARPHGAGAAPHISLGVPQTVLSPRRRRKGRGR